MASNCFVFFFSNSKDSEVKEMQRIFAKGSPKAYKEAKLLLLECIISIDHPNYFQTNMI